MERNNPAYLPEWWERRPSPLGGLAFDGNGNLIGTTVVGGDWSVDAGTNGTVFMLTPTSDGTWKETVLHGFCGEPGCADGSGPESGVVVHDGKIYGTTIYGGGGENTYGVVYELTKDGNGWLPNAFALGGAEGAGPVAPVLLRQGSLVGVTQQGGIVNGACQLFPSGNGVVFQLSHQGGKLSETVLYSFSGGSDGCGPTGGMIADATGNIYGTTLQGGSLGLGVVFEVTP